jgi:arginine/lysine/ornithine decarboxylase
MTERVPALVEDLRAYYKGEAASFHMPGHKQRGGVHPLSDEVFGPGLLRADVSEMGGFDYLHAPSGSLRRAQDDAARVFGAIHSFFLVNGSTGGNLSAVTAFAGDGAGVLALRGSHRSVYTALVLAGAEPVYVPMHHDVEEDGWFLAAGLETLGASIPERLAVVHVTRPNYYGMACDLAPYRALADATGAILIVDEAHGSHFGLVDGLPPSALQLGADVVIQSTHKTLSALTQASMLHVGERVASDPTLLARLTRSLAMLQSSSPSALLTLSLDLAASHLDGEGRIQLAATVALAFAVRAEIAEIGRIRLVGAPESSPSVDLDPTKLVINVTGLGLSGFAAAQWLREHHRLHVELADYRRIVCSLTVGDDTSTAQYLLTALRDLASSEHEPSVVNGANLPSLPPIDMLPRQAVNAPTERIPTVDTLGRICAEYVIPYPPGIPLIVPGERVTSEVLESLAAFQQAGSKVVGPDDQGVTQLRVVAAPF